MRSDVSLSPGSAFAMLAAALVFTGLSSDPQQSAHGQTSKPPGAKTQRPPTNRPDRSVDRDRTGPVREIFEGKRGGKVPEGSTVEKPAVLDSRAELKRVARNLAERFPNEDIPEKFREVDLGEEKVLNFAWSGSGGDRLGVRRGQPRDGRRDAGDDRPGKAESRRDADVVFLFRPGLTRDLSTHFAVYAIPKGATYRVETVRPKDRPVSRPPAGDRPNARPR